MTGIKYAGNYGGRGGVARTDISHHAREPHTTQAPCEDKLSPYALKPRLQDSLP